MTSESAQKARLLFLYQQQWFVHRDSRRSETGCAGMVTQLLGQRFSRG